MFVVQSAKIQQTGRSFFWSIIGGGDGISVFFGERGAFQFFLREELF
jgi:hypothetical protein